METSTSYLRHDPIFDTEKPFDIDVPVSHIPKARASNHQNDERNVVAHPLTDATQFSLEKHGFCITRAKTKLNHDLALKRKREVQKDYWYEIEAILHENLPQTPALSLFWGSVREKIFFSLFPVPPESIRRLPKHGHLVLFRVIIPAKEQFNESSVSAKLI